MTTTWDRLRAAVGPPTTLSGRAKGDAATGGPVWWLPSLVYLGYLQTERADAREALDTFAARRDELSYAVVEEKTDAVLGLSIQPWPLVDEQGRLRFPIDRDPLGVEVAEDDLATLVLGYRNRWKELGLLPADLDEREITIGTTFALAVAKRRHPLRVRVLAHPPNTRLYIGGLAATRERPGSELPLVDITWDAREAGKIAHYAAAAGVVHPETLEPAMAPVVEETETRYMIGYETGRDPRDLAATDTKAGRR